VQRRNAYQPPNGNFFVPIIYTSRHSGNRLTHAKMSKAVKLSDTPRMLNRRTWRTLRAFAPSDLLALVYINAPYPDEADPNDFFWDRARSASDAVRCYKIGRSLLRECRARLNSGKLVATGRDASGKREIIPASEWVDLWPMFATDRAVGPDRAYDEVQVFEPTPLETPQAELSSDCIAWLQAHKTARLVGKKFALFEDAQQRFGAGLTRVIFDAAYLSVFGRKRGRPKSFTKSKH
jgi:hypothetical protein